MFIKEFTPVASPSGLDEAVDPVTVRPVAEATRVREAVAVLRVDLDSRAARSSCSAW